MLLISIFFYVRQPAADVDSILSFLGYLCMIFNIATVAAPLIALVNKFHVSQAFWSVLWFLSIFCFLYGSRSALLEVSNKVLEEFLNVVCTLQNLYQPISTFLQEEVIRSRSTENLPLPLCIANLIVTTEWLLYGVVVNDFFIKVCVLFYTSRFILCFLCSLSIVMF